MNVSLAHSVEISFAAAFRLTGGDLPGGSPKKGEETGRKNSIEDRKRVLFHKRDKSALMS